MPGSALVGSSAMAEFQIPAARFRERAVNSDRAFGGIGQGQLHMLLPIALTLDMCRVQPCQMIQASDS
jgi:hypothetical protein